jgi:hypothetical protein
MQGRGSLVCCCGAHHPTWVTVGVCCAGQCMVLAALGLFLVHKHQHIVFGCWSQYMKKGPLAQGARGSPTLTNQTNPLASNVRGGKRKKIPLTHVKHR